MRRLIDARISFESETETHGRYLHMDVSFLTAVEIFANEIMERIDDREDYGEVRWIVLGRADTEVFRVVYTWRGDRLIRIISAQKASRDERDIYHRQTLP